MASFIALACDILFETFVLSFVDGFLTVYLVVSDLSLCLISRLISRCLLFV
jgi:hypothetical protein